ncbi:MAG TPA: OadG family protein [Candidatus Treponema faecavium]|nr:OadG family protein [Candidatus Treponema faecavium]
MTIIDMLGQSLILTLLGMGVVFVFLIILIFCLTLVKHLLHALKLDEEAPKTTAAVPSAAPTVQPAAAAANANPDAVVAAIAASLHEKES